MNKESLIQIISNSYLYICTRDVVKYDVLDKFRQRLGDLEILHQDTKTEEYRLLTIKSNSFFLPERFLYFSKINDQNDYSLDNLVDIYPHKNHLEDFDTLLACAFVKDNNFVAYSDYLGMVSHYYYYDNLTFISSNNSFLVALIAEKNVSISSIYETLFFRFPYGNNSYFDEIKIINSFNYLQYDFTRHILKTPSFLKKSNVADLYIDDIDTGVADFWSKIRRKDNNVKLSFSGGSDSMTILSLLDFYGIPFDLCAFEGHNIYDTERIQKLASNLGHRIEFMEVKSPTNQDIDDEYTIVSNGYAVSAHFHKFYKQVPKVTMFDGYSFALGDWSDAFLSDAHKDTLMGLDIEKTIRDHFIGFDSEFLFKMKMYFVENYSFPQINDNNALHYMQNYSLEFITRKILSGVLASSLFYGINNYSFFLSKKFFSPVLRQGLGIAKTFNGRIDYDGYIMNRRPLAYIASTTGSNAFLAKMDHGISLRDIKKNDRIVKIKSMVYKKWMTVNSILQTYSNHAESINSGQGIDKNILMPDFVVNHKQLSSYSISQIEIMNSVANSISILRKLLIH